MKRIHFNFSGSKRDFQRIKSLLPSCYYTSAYLRGKTKAFSGNFQDGDNIEEIKATLKAMGATKIEMS